MTSMTGITRRLINALMAAALACTCLASCVQIKPTPGYARAGDHIVLGLGGIIRNAGGESVLTASDLAITLTDANSQVFQLEPRFIFKSYADYSAYANTFILDGSAVVGGLTGMLPYDGGWFVVCPLTEQGQYNTPLALAVGQATISVSSAKLTNTADSIEGDLSDIPIEIIAGTSAQDINFVQQFLSYPSTIDSFFIQPDTLNGVNDVGGAYFEIDYNDESFFANGLEPVVVPLDHNPYVQLSYNVISNGDNTGSIRITLLNPAGFKTTASASANSSYLSDLTVRLNYFSNGTATQAKQVFSIDTVNSRYIDLNGLTLGGIIPTLVHLEDI